MEEIKYKTVDKLSDILLKNGFVETTQKENPFLLENEKKIKKCFRSKRIKIRFGNGSTIIQKIGRYTDICNFSALEEKQLKSIILFSTLETKHLNYLHKKRIKFYEIGNMSIKENKKVNNEIKEKYNSFNYIL